MTPTGETCPILANLVAVASKLEAVSKDISLIIPKFLIKDAEVFSETPNVEESKAVFRAIFSVTSMTDPNCVTIAPIDCKAFWILTPIFWNWIAVSRAIPSNLDV